MIRAGLFNECGQGIVEFALVTAAFLAAVIALGALWRGLGGRHVRRSCADVGFGTISR